jgi:hypothetical protein
MLRLAMFLANLHCRDRAAQINSHWLTQGDQADGFALNIFLQVIKAVVAADYALRQRYITTGYGVHGIGDLRFGKTTQQHNFSAELF